MPVRTQLVVRGHLAGAETDPRSDVSMIKLSYEVFTAGLDCFGFGRPIWDLSITPNR